MSRHALVLVAVVAAQCGGQASPTAPAAPSPGGGIGLVRTVTVDRTNVEAGDQISLQVTLEGNTPSSQLRFTWSVTPPGGTLTSEGPSARWRAPLNDPVPATYTFLVSVVQPDGASPGSLGATSATTGGTSAQVTVNDARRELQAHSEAFLADLANAAIAPDVCVRNFTQSCDGRREAMESIAASRTRYSSATTSYRLQLFVRSVEWPNCTSPDGSARCAVLLYRTDSTWSRRDDGTQDHIVADHALQGFYEQNRWWLCSSAAKPATTEGQ